MKRVYFLAAAIPALDTIEICKTFLWANQNGFQIEQTFTNMIPTSRSPIQTRNQTASVMELVSIYASSLPERFEDHFKKPYSAQGMIDIAPLIKEQINGINF